MTRADADALLQRAEDANARHEVTDAEQLACQAAALYDALGAHTDHARALLAMSIGLYHQGDFAQALTHLGHARHLAERDPAPDTHLLGELDAQSGVTCRQLGLQDRALAHYHRALARVDPDDPDEAGLELLSTLHNNIAIIHLGQQNHDACLAHFERGLAASARLSTPGVAQIFGHINLGKVLLKLARHDEAIPHLERGHALAADHDSLAMQMRAQEGLATARHGQGHALDALELITPVVEHWASREDPMLTGLAMLTQGHILRTLERLPEAHTCFLDAFTRAQAISYDDLMHQACSNLIDVCHDQAAFEEACSWYEQLHALERVRLDRERSQQIEALATRQRVLESEREAELHRVRHHELEDLVARRTASLRRSNRELTRARDGAQAAARAKATFLATTTHDLVEPLHHTIDRAQNLRALIQTNPEPDQISTELLALLGSAESLHAHIQTLLENVD